MGVPAFFRWLSRKYPSVIVYCVEEKPKNVDGVIAPVNSAEPNPNGVEFDNLYLDMNGIIHPCTHPEDKPAPKNEDEMMIAIFECIDRLFSIVRPRKLLYMAIDGVAPRAKMNQQRSRRFRASKESVEKIEEIARLREELRNKGAFLPPEKPKEDHFDSNCITPGTPFMARLSTCLNYYILDRLNSDPGWKGLKVILSDANVPGEGEHKIMDFIRKQRAQPDHDPNTQHVLCGADADLIMLGLATHEPNFTIIREEFRPNKPKPCDICHQLGHEMKNCVGCPKPLEGGVVDAPIIGDNIPFIFVRLNVLREYLERELTMPDLPFPYDFERAVDDWVFMCFFVGNDFLPHLPSLEIREGAIDRLVNLYKNCVYRTGGFVTDSGDVNLNRVQLILSELGKVEDEIFKKRQENEVMFKQRNAARKRMAAQNKNDKPAWIPSGQLAPVPLGSKYGTLPSLATKDSFLQRQTANMHTKAGLESLLRPEGEKEGERHGVKRPLEDDDSEDEVHDEVRLWEDGFKERYYESKFDIPKENTTFRIKVAHEYIRGLCWVLRYYYQGCASWKWYFPYHYAPFASDFIDIGSLSTSFEKGTEPFRPLEQLMGVFPAASSSHVPKPWAVLMHDPYSPIIDFYPIDFKIDLNGKKFAWQGVALLPFVDETRLFKALEPLYDKLTPEEKRRNVRGTDKVYVGTQNSGYNFIKGLYNSSKTITDEEFDFCADGMRGKITLMKEFASSNSTILSPIKNLPTIHENEVISVCFKDLTYPANHIFKAKRLKGVIEPQRVLKPGDLSYERNRNWVPQTGMVPSTQRAFVNPAGHRMLNHYNNSNNNRNPNFGRSFSTPGERGAYSQVPPPTSNFGSYNYSQNSYGYSTVGSSSSQQRPQNNYGKPQNYNSGRDFRGYNSRNQQEQGTDRRGYNDRGHNYNERGNNYNERGSNYNDRGNNYNERGNNYDRNNRGRGNFFHRGGNRR